MNKITKVTLPEREGEYFIMLYSTSKFLINDGNTLYFEVTLSKDRELPSISQHKLYIIKFVGNESTNVPENCSFICSFEDNAKIRYFVFEDISKSPIVEFMNLFKF